MIKLFQLENIVLHYFCPKSLAKMLSGMNWRTSKTLIDSNSSVRMISIQPHQRMKWFYNKVLSSREWANGNIKRFLLIIPSSNWTRLFLLVHLLSRKGFIHFQIYWYPLEAIVSRNVVQSWYYNWYLTIAEICFLYTNLTEEYIENGYGLGTECSLALFQHQWDSSWIYGDARKSSLWLVSVDFSFHFCLVL